MQLTWEYGASCKFSLRIHIRSRTQLPSIDIGVEERTVGLELKCSLPGNMGYHASSKRDDVHDHDG